MDWDKLKIFHAVAEAGSFTNATVNLNLSQSAISRQIQSLEQDLKVQLFERHARGLTLTENGEYVFKTAHEVISKLKEVETSLGDQKNKPTGKLTITTVRSFGTHWLTPRIQEFMTLNPEIEIDLVFDDKELDLSTRQADIGIFMRRPKQLNYIQKKLVDIKYYIYGSNKYLEKYGDNIPIEYHPKIRSEEACLKSTLKIIDLAKKCNSRLHVFHLSTKSESKLFEILPLENKNITSEVCIHHLSFNDLDYKEKGAFIKWNPAVKSELDQDALWEALNSDRIDIVATDHAPHQLEGKSNDYMDCPSGIPSVQHTLLVLLELVREGVYSLDDLPYYLSHKVADRFKIIDRGYIREGYWADCVLVDLEHQHKITKENTSYFCGWSPFEGDTFNSKVISTFVNGTHAYNEGKILETNLGMQLEFDR